MIPPAAKSTRSLSLVVGVAVLLSAAALGFGALLAGDQPYWLLILMQVCAALAGVTAVLFGRGSFQEAPAMALLCIAGTVGVTGFLSWLSVRQGIVLGGRTINLKLWMLAHAGACGLLATLAAWEVLRRDPRGPGRMARGCWLFCACGLCGAAMILLTRKGGALPQWLVWIVLAVLSVGVLAFFSAGLHAVIRAFESGRLEEPPAAR
jgi:hypothetical protein